MMIDMLPIKGPDVTATDNSYLETVWIGLNWHRHLKKSHSFLAFPKFVVAFQALITV